MAQLPLIPRKPEAPSEFAFLRKAWEQGRQPDPKLTVSEWADRHRILSSRGSNEAGPWRTSRTPYLRAVMDALSPSHPARRIILMKGSQIGVPLALTTSIATPAGWSTIGDLCEGDVVFDEQGQPTRVLGKSPVYLDRECFRLTFSDGAELVADAIHLWWVHDEVRQTERTLRTRKLFTNLRAGGGCRFSVPAGGKGEWRRITNVERVASVPVQCILIDAPSHLFLAGRELIATHNTEAGVNWIGYVIHHAPGPMMIVWPTLDMCRRNSKQRIETMIAECPALQERVAPQRTHSGSNTILVKEFSGGILVILGSNSASGLRSMPVRYLFLDEVDVYPPFVGKGMDPVEEVIKRTSTFEHRSKVLMASTPTIEHASRIEEQFLASNQQYFFVPCPRCGHMQRLIWERLRWEKGRFATVHYECEACEGWFFEHEKTQFLSEGEWHATAESTDPFTVGFHLSSLYSPYGWLSWTTCAKEWEAAAGSPEKQRSFCTEVLGLSWREKTDAPSWQRLYDRREEWQFGSVPRGVLLLTAGADVQRDRIEVSVWGWARGFESWLVDHIVLRGKPSEAAVWGEMTALMGRVWLAAGEGNGNREAFQLRRLAIDTGDQTLEVYAWQRSVPTLPIMCVKGMDRWDREMPVSGPRRIDTDRRGKKRLRGVELYTVSVSTFKAQFYAQLSAERPTDEDLACGVAFPPGYVHLARGTPADLIQQLVSEECVAIKTRTGRVKREWRKVQERNEGLDCFDAETEVLTRDGWRNFAALTGAESLATVNLETDLIEYQQPTALIARDYVGEMVSIEGRRISILVTPNHRMVTYRKVFDRTAGKWRFDVPPQITLAKDLTIHHQLKLTGKWAGERVERVHIPASVSEQGFVIQPARDVDAGDLAAFLGWYVSEGHRRKSYHGASVRRAVAIDQNEGAKADEIRGVLGQLPWQFSEYQNTVGCVRFVVTSKQLYDLAGECGVGSAAVRVPQWIKDADPEVIRRFVDAAIAGDGWVRCKERQRPHRTYGTISRVLADDMQELFIKLGTAANIKIKAAEEMMVGMIRGREVRAVHDQYHVSECKVQKASLDGGGGGKREYLGRRVSYAGKVYCASVPNGTLILRRHGRSFIAGNCRSYARAALWEADVYGDVFWEGLERERVGERDEPEAKRGIPAERVPQQQGGGWVGRVNSRWV